MDVNSEQEVVVVVACLLAEQLRLLMVMFTQLVRLIRRRRRKNLRGSVGSYSLKSKIPSQIRHLSYIVGWSDTICRQNLRMNTNTFSRLCYLLENVGGLVATRNVSIVEQVALFLHVLSHHEKNVIIQTNYKRSGYTISIHFSMVLHALLKLHNVMLVSPIPVDGNCDLARWKFFQGCLGALDGSYVQARVSLVYNQGIGIERGSAADSRILQDTVTLSDGLCVPTGNYCLVDNGYTNGPGFLAPYRNTRYHLQEFGVGRNTAPNYEEYFNLKHAKTRNTIERAFGILKSRWGILRSPSYYLIKIQNWIIMACCLLHNFIHTTYDHDPEEDEVPEEIITPIDHTNNAFVETVEASPERTTWRDTLAINIYNERLR